MMQHVQRAHMDMDMDTDTDTDTRDGSVIVHSVFHNHCRWGATWAGANQQTAFACSCARARARVRTRTCTRDNGADETPRRLTG